MFTGLFRSPRTARPAPDTAALQRSLEARGLHLDAEQARTLDRLAAAGPASVYLWGAVGRGKSWLLEEFYALLPEPSRQRLHFHAFLGGLQTALAARPGRAEHVLSTYGTECRVLLFDEFHLHDVADAHLLNRWLPRALSAGVRILATSNYPPGRLLPDPLFHEAALPTIRTIESAFEVIELAGTRDYRVSRTTGQTARPGWVRDSPLLHGPLTALKVPLGGGGRTLEAQLSPDGVFVASFSRLCQEPLSARDHLSLARRWPRWLIMQVPQAESMDRESMQRWANLVDVLYDERVDVVFQSGDPPPHDSVLERGLRDAARFVSRLRHLAERPFV